MNDNQCKDCLQIKNLNEKVIDNQEEIKSIKEILTDVRYKRIEDKANQKNLIELVEKIDEKMDKLIGLDQVINEIKSQNKEFEHRLRDTEKKLAVNDKTTKDNDEAIENFAKTLNGITAKAYIKLFAFIAFLLSFIAGILKSWGG